MADAALPPVAEDGLRSWTVAGAVLREHDRILLVENQRRNGIRDWSTPGGVIEAGEDVLDGLSREVVEESGFSVSAWEGPLYRVHVLAPELGFRLSVTAFAAQSFTGAIHIDDPDGIVTAAQWVPVAEVADYADVHSPWVFEPLLAHLAHGFSDGRTFNYAIEGRDRGSRRIIRQPVDDGGSSS